MVPHRRFTIFCFRNSLPSSGFPNSCQAKIVVISMYGAILVVIRTNIISPFFIHFKYKYFSPKPQKWLLGYLHRSPVNAICKWQYIWWGALIILVYSTCSIFGYTTYDMTPKLTIFSSNYSPDIVSLHAITQCVKMLY
jgi:hypothetical protein